MTKEVKKIGISELRNIVKEAVADFKKKSASEKRLDIKKDKEKAAEKDKLKESSPSSQVVKVTMEQLQKMIKEAVDKRLSENEDLEAIKQQYKQDVSGPAAIEAMPSKGDKVRLASGKDAIVADVDMERNMVFITRDGVKMIGVPMDYVSVVGSGDDTEEPADFVPTPGKNESPEERLATLEKYLSRPFLAADTRKKLSVELAALKKTLGKPEDEI